MKSIRAIGVSIFVITSLVGCDPKSNDPGDPLEGQDTELDTGDDLPILDTATIGGEDTATEAEIDTDSHYSCEEDYLGECKTSSSCSYGEDKVDESVSDCEDNQVCCLDTPTPHCVVDLGGQCESGAIGLCPDGMVFANGATGCITGQICCAPPEGSCTEDFGGECFLNGDSSCEYSRLATHTDCTVGSYCCVDNGCLGEMETNDDSTSALSLDIPAIVCGDFPEDGGTPDDDYYVFTLAEQSRIVIKLSGTSTQFSNYNSLMLYESTFDPELCDIEDPSNGCLKEIDGNSNPHADVFAGINTLLEAGTYYVRFHQYTEVSGGDYRLEVKLPDCEAGESSCDHNDLKTCTSLGEWDQYQCGDICEEITDEAIPACVTGMTLPFEGTGETTIRAGVFYPEYYKFTIGEADDITIILDTMGEIHNLFLYTENFTPKAPAEDCDVVDGCLFHLQMADPVMLQSITAGTYFIRIEGQRYFGVDRVGPFTLTTQSAECQTEGERGCTTEGDLGICNEYGILDAEECLNTCANRGDGVLECRGETNSCWDAYDLDVESYPFAYTPTEVTMSQGFESIVRCSGNAAEDMWFKFTATTTSHAFEIAIRTFTQAKIFENSCNSSSMAEVACDGAYNYTLGGLDFTVDTLNIGQTYLVALSHPLTSASFAGNEITIDIQ